MNTHIFRIARTVTAALFVSAAFVLGAAIQRGFADSNTLLLISWSSDTHVPLEYRQYARALPIKGANLSFTATPYRTQAGAGRNATRILYTPTDPQSFYFVWYINDSKYDQGQGVSSETYPIDPYVLTDAVNVRVQIFDATTGDPVTEQQLRIPVLQQPQALLYPVVDGKILPVAQETFSGARNATLTIVAKPYFFNVPDEKQISFTWYHRGTPISAPDNDPSSFRITLPSVQARDEFALTLVNMLHRLQFVSTRFLVQAQ